jgi:hypothetical protein
MSISGITRKRLSDGPLLMVNGSLPVLSAVRLQSPLSYAAMATSVRTGTKAPQRTSSLTAILPM